VGDRWATGRTEAFSDGVFAIAITLLVLDLSIPTDQLDHPWRAIVHQWPSYLAYLTSFATIGSIWLIHHGIFTRIRYVDSRVMRLNLVLLLAASILPYPTRLVSEAIRHPHAERAMVFFYGLCLLAVATTLRALWRAATRDRELVHPDVSDDEIRALTLASTPSIGFFVAATVLAIFLPGVAAAGYCLIALTALVRVRGDQPGVAAGGI
jgi:uncharacterized membrane protein